MGQEDSRRVNFELRATNGPTAVSFRLQPPGPLIIGRRSASSLQLNDPAVSRDHARLAFRQSPRSADPAQGEWLLDDLGSVHGTCLNGVRVKANRQYHLRAGDLIVIGPWTLLAADRSAGVKAGTTLVTVQNIDQVGTVVVRAERPADAEMDSKALRILQCCSERVHAGHSEVEVLDAILDAAIEGTGFTRIAFLRPMTEDEVVEIASFRSSESGTAATHRPSRALIKEASSGAPARLQRGMHGDVRTKDQAETQYVTALCVPVTVESTVVGFIYFDQWSNEAQDEQRGGAPDVFPIALAKIAGSGIANLMRLDMERRHERTEVELHAAEEAKRWLLPPRCGEIGPFRYAGETRPGKLIGGNFFDVIVIGEERLGVVVADVGGRGIPVSVLVSASQGFLHSCLAEHSDPAHVVARVNELYRTRIGRGRFMKLWLGVLDAGSSSLTYVAAGHLGAVVVHADGRFERLDTGKTMAVGVEAESEYVTQTIPMKRGAFVAIVSGGFLEQRGADIEPESSTDPGASDAAESPMAFGFERFEEVLRGVSPDDNAVESLFSALEAHAGTTEFDDDATAVVVRV